MRRSRGNAARPLAVWVLVGPYVVFLVAFGLAPAAFGLWSSLGSWGEVFNDYRLGPAVRNVGLYLVLWLPVLVLLVLSLALTLHARPGRFAGVMRFVYYLPGAVTGSAAALLWLFMVSPDVSPFGPLLSALGVGSASQTLQGDGLIGVLVVMGLAIHAGGWIVVLYGALTALPRDVLEAAAVDGATPWHITWHVKLPLVRRYVAFVVISSFASGSQVFVEPTVLATGVPGQISPTWSVNQLAYFYAAQEGDFGRAAALSLAMLAVGLVAALLVIYKTRFYQTDAA
ncbi:carbohydrate ABC transporter permease [Planotetraspora sp. GP83]|uniref:carbohydrate ABC transporter permease n=1 Tax=Planotetraspora sp. GP83 TaxID=3156264 RepID=UPI003518DDD4